MEETYKRKLVDYLKKNLKKAYPADTLKWALINQGYSKIAVQRALEIATKELAEKAPALKEKPVIKYEIIDENNNPITIKKSFFKRIFGL